MEVKTQEHNFIYLFLYWFVYWAIVLFPASHLPAQIIGKKGIEPSYNVTSTHKHLLLHYKCHLCHSCCDWVIPTSGPVGGA